MINPKLTRAMDFLQGKTVKRQKSRYCFDNPVRKGAFEVQLTPSDIKPLTVGYYGRRLNPD